MRRRTVHVLSGPAARAGTPRDSHYLLVAVAVLAVVLLAIGMLVLSAKGETHAPLTTRLVSDCDGAITDWILGVPDGDHMFFENAQAEIITKADAGIRFHVHYAHDARRASLRRALEQRGWRDDGRVSWHQAQGLVWPWVRDLFLAATTPEGTPVFLLHHADHYLRRSSGPTLEGMRRFAGTLEGARSLGTNARIDGGSVVVDRERVFASRAFVEAAIRHDEAESAKEIVERLGATWGLPVELVSIRAAHPSRHSDLVMMPAGKKRMVLASPALGARLLATVGGEERARFTAAYGAIVERAPRGHGLVALGNFDMLGAMQARNARAEVQQAYTALRRRLERLGYECVELPQLGLTFKESGCGTTFSYVNAVIDQRAGQRTVYMPTYGLPTLDGYAARVWRRLGYRVVAIDCLAPAMDGGSLHCLSQVFRTRLQDVPAYE